MILHFYLFIIPQESYSLQWEHVFILVAHFVVVFLPHLYKLIAVYQTDKLITTCCSMLGNGRSVVCFFYRFLEKYLEVSGKVLIFAPR